ncbi:Phospholipid scramblase family protein C343.06c [Zea mays]|uniref:Phospholipid scramblase n=1 Tax=Zea mays TaxID=4577 RepID=A0A3L6FSI6_MAIZE|nr:Phospholipid scramblase family protein C343.06c [Zea mays]
MRWLPRLLSHSIEVGGPPRRGAVPREWLRKLWVDVLKKQKEDARRWGIGASPGNAGSGAEPSLCAFANSVEAAGATREAPSRSYQDIEWANIMLAFEQESRYIIMDPLFPQSPVGFIREKSNIIFRQLLRTRRPFVAEITDAMGNEIFKVRRPFWWINSSVYAEVDGKEIGVVHRRWHLWRRIYDLYLGNRQFAVVENPGFWNWTFSLVDEDDKLLAQIDRNWKGIDFELFTDAGQYAIRFGDDVQSDKFAHLPFIISGYVGAHLSQLVNVSQKLQTKELHVVRQLTLPERAVALALAISLDSDYFSRRGGWGLPYLIATE